MIFLFWKPIFCFVTPGSQAPAAGMAYHPTIETYYYPTQINILNPTFIAGVLAYFLYITLNYLPPHYLTVNYVNFLSPHQESLTSIFTLSSGGLQKTATKKSFSTYLELR